MLCYYTNIFYPTLSSILTILLYLFRLAPVIYTYVVGYLRKSMWNKLFLLLSSRLEIEHV